MILWLLIFLAEVRIYMKQKKFKKYLQFQTLIKETDIIVSSFLTEIWRTMKNKKNA